jgi:hypothetical protein
MNFRLTAILFGLVLLVGVALLVRTFFAEPPEASTLIPSLAGLKADQIDVVEIEKHDPPAILKLERKGKDQWVIAEPVQTKADSTLVTATINAVLKAKPTAFSDNRSNPAVSGLQPPSLRVTLRQGNERSGTLNIGNVSIGGSSAIVFVSTQARSDRPIAVNRSDLDPLFRDTLVRGGGKAEDLVKWTVDYRVKAVFPAESRMVGGDVTALKLSLPNKKKELALSLSPDGWKFDVPAGWGEADPVGDLSAMPNTFTGVQPLLRALTSLQALTPDDFVDNPKDLKEYGLNSDNPDLLRVEMHTREGVGIVFLGRKEGAIPPMTPGGAPTGKIWVRIEGQPGVIRANSGDISGLVPVIENPDPLRDRTLLAAEKSRIDGIDLTVAGQTTKLRRAGAVPEWKLFGNSTAGDPQPTSRPVVDKLLDVLTERRTIKGFPVGNPANFAPPEIKAEVKVWAAGFEPTPDDKAEPKEKGKPTTLLFGKKEGDSIYVRRTLPDGTVGEFLLADRIKLGGETVELIPAITKTRLDFLDPNLKTFSTGVANKITVSGIKNYELDKEEKKDPSSNQDRWTFVSPADQKGKTADAKTVLEMLRILSTTHSVTRFVDETPSPAKLIEYGLASPAMPPPMSPPSPRLKVVIGLKETDAADKERVFEFGAITGDFVYARQTGKAAVFTLPKFVFDQFAEADLRDRSIFQFDPAKITAIEFKGWGAAGFVTDLHFEKNKEGVWAVTKSPGPYTVDPKKIETFLTVLNTTNVKAFLPGVPTVEQGFGDVKVSLIIVLTTAAGPLISLNLGASTDGGSSYYGWTSILPQTAPVFTVDADRFKMYKESSGVFAK